MEPIILIDGRQAIDIVDTERGWYQFTLLDVDGTPLQGGCTAPVVEGKTPAEAVAEYYASTR